MMPILYVGGYSEMDGLKLTCEFTFNKKEKGKLVNYSVEMLYCFHFSNVLVCLNFLSQNIPLKMDTTALRN